MIHNDHCILVDFLNLLKSNTGKNDALFSSEDELLAAIKTAVGRLKEYITKNHADKKVSLIIVTKSFTMKEINDLSYNDIIRMISWVFASELEETVYNIKIVLTNGEDTKDKEADDRALFHLYNAYKESNGIENVTLISNDKFRNLEDHYHKKVVCNFFWKKKTGDSWRDCNSVLLDRITFSNNIFQYF